MTHQFFVFLSTERNQLNYIVVVLFWSQSKCTGYKTVDEPLRFYTQVPDLYISTDTTAATKVFPPTTRSTLSLTIKQERRCRRLRALQKSIKNSAGEFINL